MELRYRLIGLVEGSIDHLPRFLARPLERAIVFVYFARKWLIVVFLPSVLAGALVPALIADLPLEESIPALLVLAVLVVIVWWQFFEAEKLRERLKASEAWREEHTVYYSLDENGQEKLCDD